MKSVLYKKYKEEIVPALKAELSCSNVMEVPKIRKIVINAGYGRNVKDKNFIEAVEKTLTMITGQKPVHNKAKKSISNFKIREGMNIGISVTLRGEKMYNFLYKLINITLPRVRDFRGLNPKSFDKNGNYTLGFKENLSFPEVSTESSETIHGLEVVVDTSAKNEKEGRLLLEKIGFPFKKNNK